MFAQANEGERKMTYENETIDLLKSISSINRKYINLVDQNLAQYELSSSTYYYIVKLYELGDLPQDKIVQLTGINASNVTRAIQKLLVLKYILKIENPKDRRKYFLSLTNKGRSMYQVIQKTLNEANTTLFQKLTSQEQKEFIYIISKI